MTGNIALSKDEQKSFFKDVNSIKKLIQKGQIKVKDVKEKKVYKKGVVYVGHLPPGFNEVAMKSYFKQFGTVTRVRLARSAKSGKSRGYAYIEYRDTDVAKIVAETMNNYLMKNRLLKATYIPPENQHKGFFAGKNITENNTPLMRIRRKEFNRKNRNLAEKEQADAVEKNEARLKKMQKKIAAAGVNYEIVHKGNSILPNSSTLTIPSASSSKNKSQKKKSSFEKKTDVKQVKKNMVSKRFVQPPSSDEDKSDDDVISWDGKDDSDITDGNDLDETVEEETKHNFVRLPLKNKNVKKNKNIPDTSSSSISPPKSKNKKKAKAAESPATSPKQKKNKNAKKSKSEGDNKLLQKKKSGGIEKVKPKNKKELISNDKKLKLAAAEIMKSQEVPKLKDQKLKIKSKKNKKQ